jgi:hypothetical protein
VHLIRGGFAIKGRNSAARRPYISVTDEEELIFNDRNTKDA